MSETVIDTPVLDTYKEHTMHHVWDNHCSTCYNDKEEVMNTKIAYRPSRQDSNDRAMSKLDSHLLDPNYSK